MMNIGCMIWRIGDILDFYDQIEWIKHNGFDAVEFWTLPGSKGYWQGFDVQSASSEDIAKLKFSLDGFSEIDIHAGFDSTGKLLMNSVDTVIDMKTTFEFAAEIGSTVITVHPAKNQDQESRIRSLEKLNRLSIKYGVFVGIETMGGKLDIHNMELVKQLSLSNVGISLDLGHLHFEDGAAFRNYGSPGGFIDDLSSKLLHLHVHDYNGQYDHLAVGNGYIDFNDVLGSLVKMNFSGSMILEINPDREPVEDILKSRDKLKDIILTVMHS